MNKTSMMMNLQDSKTDYSGWCWAAFFARWILGLLFLMAGWYKVVTMGAEVHATQLFVEGYKDFWIPAWLLYGTGYVIPFIELVGGVFLLIGLRIRTILITFGILLIIVTYGHLLKEPFYDITTHILPRSIFLLFLLWMPEVYDRWSIDYLLLKRSNDL